MHDLKSNLGVVTSLAPATYKTTPSATAVDLANVDGAMIAFVVGTITDGTHTPKIQESSDNSTFTDVDAADLIGTLAALDDDTDQKVSYIGSKRYIKPVVTISGSPSTGGAYGVVVVTGHGRKRPVA